MQPSLSGKQFEIGLAMAGAISAGSYTGGVFDFLMQALDEWENARSDDALRLNIPNHRVGIKVISGASAGAVTGAVGAIALAGGIRPQNFIATPTPANPQAQTVKYVLPSLYNAWVVAPCMVSSIGARDFLSTDDLSGDMAVTSLLDAGLLESVRDHALRIQPSTQPSLPYIASTLHVYMTVTNMRGVPYNISFKGGDYGMMSHGDRRYFRIEDCGSWSTASQSPFTAQDKGTSLPNTSLFGQNGPSADWVDFGTASLASAAFPFGLSPIRQEVNASDYVQRQWPLAGLQRDDHQPVTMPSPAPAFPGGEAAGRYTFFSIDGGVTNNEPFEYAHFALMEKIGEPNRRGGTVADRAVIMIDPFPEPPDSPPSGKPDGSLLSIIVALFPVLKTQARFKPSEMILAGAEDVYSRFLIGPHRTLPGATKEEAYAIACGLLGGFGGFLSQRFRDHDYQLGRRNCQRFLRQSFTVPAGNQIVKAWPQSALDNPEFRNLPEPGAAYIPEYTLIPLLGSAKAEVLLEDWPQLSQDEFDALLPRIKLRFEVVSDKLIGELASRSRVMKWGIGLLLTWRKQSILDFIRLAILSDLVRRDQMQSWSIPSPWTNPVTPMPDSKAIRSVWAQLLDPSYDFFTEIGIASSTKLPRETVRSILLMMQVEDKKPFSLWSPSWRGPKGQTLYALASRKPGLLGRLPLTRQLGDLMSSPSIN